MINPDEAFEAFKEKFDKMSYEEREQYLKEMGIAFECETKTRFIPYKRIMNTRFEKAKAVQVRLDRAEIEKIPAAEQCERYVVEIKDIELQEKFCEWNLTFGDRLRKK